MMSHHINGLYAITPDITDTTQLCEMTLQVLAAGVQYVQYRNKIADYRLRLAQANALSKLCKQYGTHLIINDHYDLAIEVDADGIHIGKEDIAITDARDYLGQNKIIGVSCYNQLELALGAERMGADYVAFGAFFCSKTKTNAVRASTDLLSEAKKKLNIPIVAIGGITLANASSLIDHGSNSIAVCHGLFGTQDIQFIAKKFNQLFFRAEQTFSSSS
nr:thiamine phosphate synthase [Nitrosomonas sp. Nm34]